MQLDADTITAIGSIITPFLVIFLGGIGWLVRNSIDASRMQEERWREREDRLREDRIKIYEAVLEPFEMLLSKDKKKQVEATQLVESYGYRHAAFQLVLMGSEDVVKAYNDLMQFFYQQEAQRTPKKVFLLLGNFLLAIRKSVGSENTTLAPLEMLEFMITDIRQFTD